MGGTAIRTGYVGSVGDMGAVRIGGNVVGGNMDDNDPTLDRTGFIEADRIASVTIGGSMIAGINTNLFAELTNNASIRVADDLGPVVVKGSLIVLDTVNSYTPVIISARGEESPRARRHERHCDPQPQRRRARRVVAGPRWLRSKRSHHRRR